VPFKKRKEKWRLFSRKSGKLQECMRKENNRVPTSKGGEEGSARQLNAIRNSPKSDKFETSRERGGVQFLETIGSRTIRIKRGSRFHPDCKEKKRKKKRHPRNGARPEHRVKEGNNT